MENMDFSSVDWSGLGATGVDPNVLAGAGAAGAIAGGTVVMGLVMSLAIYVILALALYRISLKTKINTKHAWFAWVPFLNVILMLNLAGFSGWYIFVLMIPFVNVIFVVYIWMKISNACKKPDYLGLLMLVPIANIILPVYLAYSDKLPKK